MRRGRTGRALSLAALFLAACAAMPRPPGLWARSVEHRVAVDRAGLVRRDGGLVLTDGAGAPVLLERGYLVQASATLVDCLGVGGDVWDDWVALAALRPGVARAGHGEALDPSAVVHPLAIDLVDGADARFGEVSFAESRYCRSHFLVTGVSDSAALDAAPADLDLTGLSLYLELTVTTPEGPLARTVASTLADGALTDLPDALVGTLEGSRATLTVTRQLRHALDGIDVETASDDVLARGVLTNLDHDAVVTLEVTTNEEAP